MKHHRRPALALPRSSPCWRSPIAGAARQPADVAFALTGDSIITRRLSVYAEPAFMRIINLIRGADVAFTNLEMLFHDYEPYAMN